MSASQSPVLRKILGGSLIGSAAIGLSSVLEYVYFLLAGHWLSPASFGLLSTATSVLTILVAVLTSGIGTTVAKFTAESSADSRAQITSGVALQVAVAVAAGALMLAVNALLIPARLRDLAPLLELIGWMLPVVALGAMLPLAFQGLQRLAEFGLAQVANVLVRILAAAVLLAGGSGAYGALGAYLPGALATCLFCAVRLRSQLAYQSLDLMTVRRLVRFAIPVSVSTVLITLFVRADVVYLKLFLAANDALSTAEINVVVGQYTAPALLARSLFYLSCGLPLALLPAISARRDLRAVGLGRILLATGAGLLGVVAVGHLLAEPLVALFFPAELVALASLLTPLLVATSALTLAYILATVLIAIGRPAPAASGLAIGFIAFTVASWQLITGAAGSPQSALGVALALALGATVSLLWLAAALYRIETRHRRDGAPTPGERP